MLVGGFCSDMRVVSIFTYSDQVYFPKYQTVNLNAIRVTWNHLNPSVGILSWQYWYAYISISLYSIKRNLNIIKHKVICHQLSLIFFPSPFLLPNNTLLSPLPPPEERVGPLEVSRSKLSRHLQGLVFRCHKCTFTCSSDQALQLHLQKHAEIKPYQCQLCYYDSSRRSQLEEHLRLEHKVSWSPYMIHIMFCVTKFKLIYIN